jgi:N-methylhydantoinase A/oxoprolinase/acetone carboxylase beta subunit
LSKKTDVIARPHPSHDLKPGAEKSGFVPPGHGVQSGVDFFHDSKGYIKIGLGVDAGGTYTDAVIFDLERNITICKAKSLTTRWDFTVGISKALEQLDRAFLPKIELVSLSTTLATNAIVENEGQKVGLVLMPPFGLDIAQNITYRPKCIVQGQLDIMGREIVPVHPDEIKSVVRQMIADHYVTAFAVSGFAGSINPEHELQVKKIIQKETGLFVSCGHELSDTLNFQTRAVTAMLNARIIPRLASLLSDLEKVMARYGIGSPVVVVKGDGTLMRSEMAKARPVETILSGPAASVAGARHLTGLDDALVVDMGGTTTDTAALSSGLVSLNAEGSNVGGHRTHVKALDIRTIGLGGDSLIRYERAQYFIGPKRVAPIAWLGRNWPGTEAAFDYLSLHLKRYRSSTRKMQILVKTGDVKSLQLSPQEEEIARLLEQRPYSLDELLHITGAIAEGSLPLQRLEENFVVQRCGLTFTDLLHINGRFEEWDTKAARQYAEFYSFLSHTPLTEMTDHILELGVKRLSMELLKRRLDDDMDPDKMDDCPVCKTLVHHLLNEQHPNYEVAIHLKHPVIGVGAPIKFFLPQAVIPFKAKAILPENADVANAIGAITSHVCIQKQLGIVPGEDGSFIVEGISGTRRFKNIEEADRFARKELTEIVHKKAIEAGTSCRSITFETKDSIPLASTGEVVFLKRTISASLKGRPDLVVKKRATNSTD